MAISDTENEWHKLRFAELDTDSMKDACTWTGDYLSEESFYNLQSWGIDNSGSYRIAEGKVFVQSTQTSPKAWALGAHAIDSFGLQPETHGAVDNPANIEKEIAIEIPKEDNEIPKEIPKWTKKMLIFQLITIGITSFYCYLTGFPVVTL